MKRKTRCSHRECCIEKIGKSITAFLLKMCIRDRSEDALKENACIIVDEAQFLSKEEVDYLVHVVDDLGVPVLSLIHI